MLGKGIKFQKFPIIQSGIIYTHHRNAFPLAGKQGQLVFLFLKLDGRCDIRQLQQRLLTGFGNVCQKLRNKRQHTLVGLHNQLQGALFIIDVGTFFIGNTSCHVEYIRIFPGNHMGSAQAVDDIKGRCPLELIGSGVLLGNGLHSVAQAHTQVLDLQIGKGLVFFQHIGKILQGIV